MWPFFSRLFNKSHSCPDLQTWKSSAENAVFVEIDLSSVVRSQESVILARNDLAHARLGKRRMSLYVASLATSVILQTPARGFERIDFQVLDWNTPAIKFYKRLGAVGDNDSRHFKFTDEAFRILAGTDDQRPGE